MDKREELIQLACSWSDKTDMYCWSDIKSASNKNLEAMIEDMKITKSLRIKIIDFETNVRGKTLDSETLDEVNSMYCEELEEWYYHTTMEHDQQLEEAGYWA